MSAFSCDIGRRLTRQAAEGMQSNLRKREREGLATHTSSGTRKKLSPHATGGKETRAGEENLILGIYLLACKYETREP